MHASATPSSNCTFFVLKALEPANSYSMCYVHVPDVDAVYREFCNQLKKTYGKIPSKGFPKITRVNDLAEDRRFNLVDPAGNRLLIGQKHDRPKLISIDLHETVTRFRHAYDIAYKLAYAKDEPAEAARVLDLGFAKAGEESSALCFQACVLRADIAVSMNDWELAVTFVQKAESLPQNDPGQEDVSEAAYRLLELKMILERGYLAD